MIKPVPLAMVLCDNIIIDKRSDKKSLIGIFSNIAAPKFPFRTHHLSVYISLTDGHGAYSTTLVCTNVRNDKIFSAEGEIDFKGGAKTVVEMVYDIGGLMIPEEGVYTFSFFCDNEPVISRECRATKVERPDTGSQEES